MATRRFTWLFWLGIAISLPAPPAGGTGNSGGAADSRAEPLASYPLLCTGEVTDRKGRPYAIRIYSVRFENVSTPSLLIYEPDSGCLTPMARPRGTKYDASVWVSGTNRFGTVLDTPCHWCPSSTSFIESVPMHFR